MMATVSDYSNQINNGWKIIQENAIKKLENFLSTGNSQVMFTKKEYMDYYT
jgi:hypothetical protein